jgi:hypothetical protein
MGQRRFISKIIDGDNFDIVKNPIQTTCPEDRPADPAKTVDSNPDCHLISPQKKLRVAKIARAIATSAAVYPPVAMSRLPNGNAHHYNLRSPPS